MFEEILTPDGVWNESDWIYPKRWNRRFQKAGNMPAYLLIVILHKNFGCV